MAPRNIPSAIAMTLGNKVVWYCFVASLPELTGSQPRKLTTKGLYSVTDQGAETGYDITSYSRDARRPWIGEPSLVMIQPTVAEAGGGYAGGSGR